MNLNIMIEATVPNLMNILGALLRKRKGVGHKGQLLKATHVGIGQWSYHWFGRLDSHLWMGFPWLGLMKY